MFWVLLCLTICCSSYKDACLSYAMLLPCLSYLCVQIHVCMYIFAVYIYVYTVMLIYVCAVNILCFASLVAVQMDVLRLVLYCLVCQLHGWEEKFINRMMWQEGGKNGRHNISSNSYVKTACRYTVHCLSSLLEMAGSSVLVSRILHLCSVRWLRLFVHICTLQTPSEAVLLPKKQVCTSVGNFTYLSSRVLFWLFKPRAACFLTDDFLLPSLLQSACWWLPLVLWQCWQGWIWLCTGWTLPRVCSWRFGQGLSHQWCCIASILLLYPSAGHCERKQQFCHFFLTVLFPSSTPFFLTCHESISV